MFYFLEMSRSEKLASVLLDNGAPLPDRFCSMFALRTLADDTAFDAIIKCITITAKNKNDLLEHELCYVLGP